MREVLKKGNRKETVEKRKSWLKLKTLHSLAIVI
jgi:hypothetical protein